MAQGAQAMDLLRVRRAVPAINLVVAQQSCDLRPGADPQRTAGRQVGNLSDATLELDVHRFRGLLDRPAPS